MQLNSTQYSDAKIDETKLSWKSKLKHSWNFKKKSKESQVKINQIRYTVNQMGKITNKQTKK